MTATIQSSAMPALVRQVPASPVSAAATVLAVYVFLIIGRVPEILTPLQSLRPILVVSLIAIGMAFTVPRRHRDGILSFPEMRAVLGLSALAVLGVPFSVWPGESFNFVTNSLSKLLILFMLLLHCIRTFEEVRRVAWGLLGAALLLALATLFLNEAARAQVTSTYDANDLAFVMVCALPLAVCLAFGDTGAWRLLAGITGLLAMAIVVQTRSRGGFVSLAAVSALLIVRLPVRGILVRILPVVAAVMVLAAVGSDAYWDRIATIWGGGGEHASTYDEGGFREARWEIWKTGLRLILENPVLGVGAGNFVTAEGLTHGTGGGVWRTAHNSFIEIGAELGVVGLILFVVLIVRGVLNCRAIIRASRTQPSLRPHFWMAHGLMFSICGYAVAGLTLSQGYSPLFYVPLALSAVLVRIVASPAAGPPSTATPGGTA